MKLMNMIVPPVTFALNLEFWWPPHFAVFISNGLEVLDPKGRS